MNDRVSRRHPPGGLDEGVDDLARLARVDLNLLVSLHVLLEERSVTRAAKRMGLSQPAMSHALNRSRRLMRDELVIRGGSGLELTPRARSLLEPLGRLLRQVSSEVLDQPVFVPSSSDRRLRISASSTISLVVVPPLMKRLATAAPGMSVQVMAPLARSEELLDRPDVDLLLLPDALPASLPRERLYSDRWVLVTAPDQDGVDRGFSMDDLRERPHVLFEAGGHQITPYTALHTAGIEPVLRVRTHDFLLIPLLLEGSDLIAIIQERLAVRLAAAGVVAAHSLPIDVPSFGVDMIWNPRLSRDSAQPWLLEQLRHVVE